MEDIFYSLTLYLGIVVTAGILMSIICILIRGKKSKTK